ncbi:MAG: hypothetical protein M1823_006213 [Watsoniomyces obsoletus]|nr:MAG: hypothetical protein M1823_006213 [Watsoniomyces obsoletus]
MKPKATYSILEKARKRSPQGKGKLPLPTSTSLSPVIHNPETKTKMKMKKVMGTSLGSLSNNKGSETGNGNGTGIGEEGLLSPAIEIFRKYPQPLHHRQLRGPRPKRTRCVSYFDDDIFGGGGNFSAGIGSAGIGSVGSAWNGNGDRDRKEEGNSGGEEGDMMIWENDGINNSAGGKEEVKNVLSESRSNGNSQHQHKRSRLPRPSFSSGGVGRV